MSQIDTEEKKIIVPVAKDYPPSSITIQVILILRNLDQIKLWNFIATCKSPDKRYQYPSLFFSCPALTDGFSEVMCIFWIIFCWDLLTYISMFCLLGTFLIVLVY